MFVYESVPGTAVENFKATENVVSFKVCGETDFQFTLGMEADAEYVVYMDDVNIGDMTTNLSGKLSVSAEAEAGKEIEIKGEYSGKWCIQRKQRGEAKEPGCDIVQCIDDR